MIVRFDIDLAAKVISELGEALEELAITELGEHGEPNIHAACCKILDLVGDFKNVAAHMADDLERAKDGEDEELPF